MKKIITVLLSLAMLFGCVALTASAAISHGEQIAVDQDLNGYIYQYRLTGDCTCTGAPHESGELCHCCVFCPNLDTSYLTDCATAQNTDGATGFDGTVCCLECDGIWSPEDSCGCVCCSELDQDINDNNSNIGDYITDEDKENFVDGFQAILKQISDAFDKFFDAIFEFLRLEKILGIELN